MTVGEFCNRAIQQCIDAWQYVKIFIIALSGGIVRLLYDISKGRKTTILDWLVELSITLFVAFIINGLIPVDWDSARVAIIAMSTFSSIKIYGVIKSAGPFIVETLLSKYKK